MTPTWTYLHGGSIHSLAVMNTIASGTFQTPHAHRVALTDASGDRIIFFGDFVIHNGVITSGTVHGFDVYDHATKVLAATGYSVAFSKVTAAIATQSLGALSPNLIQVGSAASDNIGGPAAHNSIFGGAGGDLLFGGKSHDAIQGGAGADRIDGYGGHDTLFGGAGKDVFVFTDQLFAVDTIKDFATGVDRIGLEHGMFQGIADGVLQGLQFHIGPHALTADQHIVYDSEHRCTLLRQRRCRRRRTGAVRTVRPAYQPSRSRLHHPRFHLTRGARRHEGCVSPAGRPGGPPSRPWVVKPPDSAAIHPTAGPRRIRVPPR